MSTALPRGRARLLSPILAAPAPARWPGAPWPALLVGSLLVALASLLFTDTVTYDPWSWLIWGRDIAHGDLVTLGGPSWKPLPVLFTTPLSLLGTTGAPAAWLVIARAGTLLGVALGFWIARRLAGPVAGAISVVALVLADEFVLQSGRGTSEGMLVAAAFAAIERHCSGHRRTAFAWAAVAALLRPEVWPIFALYGLWLVAIQPAGRPRGIALLAVGASGLGVVAAWLVPEKIGSGDFFRAASRALEPVANSPAQAAHPFLATFSNSAGALSEPVYAGAILAVIAALVAVRRRAHRGWLVLAIAVAATELMVTVAVFTMIGFTGNLRYVTLVAALVAVLSGPGLVWAFGAVRGRFGLAAAVVAAVLAAAAAAPFLRLDVISLRDDLRGIERTTDDTYQPLDALVRQVGRDRILACGRVATDAYQTQPLDWWLDLHTNGTVLDPRPEGSVLTPRGTALERAIRADARYRPAASNGRWVLYATC